MQTEMCKSDLTERKGKRKPLAVGVDSFVVNQSQPVAVFLELVEDLVHGMERIPVHFTPDPVVGVFLALGGLATAYHHLASVPPVHG